MPKLTKARAEALKVIGEGVSEEFLERRLHRHPVASRAFLDRLVAAGLAKEKRILQGGINLVVPTDLGRAALAEEKGE